MCKCTPDIRTPFCGKTGCEWPENDADIPTPKAQQGEWILTAPDGRTWKAHSPLAVCGLEQRERVPPNVALARIIRELDRDNI